MNQQNEIKMGDGLPLFEGETSLHLGKNHTFNDIAKAILNKLSKVEAEVLLMTLEHHMKEPWFLKKEEELQALIARVKKEIEEGKR